MSRIYWLTWNRHFNLDPFVMTPAIACWLKSLVIIIILHTIWSIVRAVRKQGHIRPANGKEWTSLMGNTGWLLLGIFLFVMVHRNFQEPLNTVLKHKDQEIQQLSFFNLSTHLPDALQHYRGKIVILPIWATRCGPCRKELPDLNKVQLDYKNQPVKVNLHFLMKMPRT